MVSQPFGVDVRGDNGGNIDTVYFLSWVVAGWQFTSVGFADSGIFLGCY